MKFKYNARVLDNFTTKNNAALVLLLKSPSKMPFTPFYLNSITSVAMHINVI